VTRRRKVDYFARHRISARPWLLDVHLSPYNSRWHFCVPPYGVEGGYLNGNNYHWFKNLRVCIEDTFSSPLSVQETWEWEYYSFLGEIQLCQDGTQYMGGRRLSGSHASTGFGCTEGCEKVHLDRMKVPESLREFHPVRLYPDS
jgi:hypothetical protein